MPSNLPSLPMAQYDAVSRSVRIDHATLDVAAALAGEAEAALPAAARPHVARLVASGLATERSGPADRPKLTSPFAEMMAVVMGSCMGVQIHRHIGPDLQIASLMLGGSGSTFIVHHEDHTCTLRWLGAGAGVDATAGFVGFDLDRRPAPARGSALAPVALDEFHARLTRGDVPGAAAALGPQRGLTTQELALLLDLVDGTARSWRVATPEAAVLVVDGDERGLWRSGHGPDGRYDHEFVPTSPADLGRLLGSMLHPPMPAINVA